MSVPAPRAERGAMPNATPEDAVERAIQVSCMHHFGMCDRCDDARTNLAAMTPTSDVIAQVRALLYRWEREASFDPHRYTSELRTILALDGSAS